MAIRFVRHLNVRWGDIDFILIVLGKSSWNKQNFNLAAIIFLIIRIQTKKILELSLIIVRPKKICVFNFRLPDLPCSKHADP